VKNGQKINNKVEKERYGYRDVGELNSDWLNVLTCTVESTHNSLWEFWSKNPKGLTVHETVVNMTPILF
jgi:hypothetical protein